MKKINVEQKVIKIKPFTEVKIYRGLCTCCTLTSTCTYPRELGRPVLQCDEFDGISPSPELRMNEVRNRSVNHFSGIPSGNQSPGMSTGLCAYCENLHTCTYPKPEGGVWHCEEYC